MGLGDAADRVTCDTWAVAGVWEPFNIENFIDLVQYVCWDLKVFKSTLLLLLFFPDLLNIYLMF